jgi:hypothetical protein
MRAKISKVSANMTGYPAVRKTAHHAPAPAELEFAMHTLNECKRTGNWPMTS